MPLYEYSCGHCKTRFEVYKHEPSPEDFARCEVCGTRAKLQVSVAAIRPDVWADPIFDLATGKRFNTNKEMHNYMRANGIEDTDSGTARDVEYNKKRLEKQADVERKRDIGKIVQEIMV